MINALKQETPVDLSANPNVVTELHLTYRTTPKITLYQDFKKLQENGIMLTSEYREDVWVFQDHLKDLHWTLDFTGLHFASELKAFSILYLSENAPITTSHVCNFIAKILRETKGFTCQAFSADQLGIITPHAYHCLLAFMEYIELDWANARIYIESIAPKVIADDTSRPLPNFQSVLAFDNLLSRFINNDLKLFPEYYPIVLWWKLTMIIPIRPIEFFQLKVHDFEKENASYYIHIQRSQKSHPKHNTKNAIPLLERFEITKDIYSLFMDYIRTINPGPKGYIFNSDTIKVRYPREFRGRSILNNLLDKFYEEIIQARYGFAVFSTETQDALHEMEIEKISYGDTRHYAFLNLLLQGYNPYSIAQLGGHRTLDQQLHYYDGMTAFCASKAYALSISHSFWDNSRAVSSEMRRGQNLLNQALAARPIPSGHCLSQNFPYECVSADCTTGECEFFIPDNLEAVKVAQMAVREDMNRKIELLKSILFKEPNDSVTREEACNGLQKDIIKLCRLFRNEDALKGDSK